MTQPPLTRSPIGNGPAELEHQRWNWLQQQFPPMGRAFDEILNRLYALDQKLDRVEGKLDQVLEAQEHAPRRRRRVAHEEPDVEQ